MKGVNDMYSNYYVAEESLMKDIEAEKGFTLRNFVKLVEESHCPVLPMANSMPPLAVLRLK